MLSFAAVLIVLRLVHPQPSFAQSTNSAATFEVASIKLTKECVGGRPRVTPSRLSLNCYNLEKLISTAYGRFANGRLNPEWTIPKVEGGPSWTRSIGYSIDAKAQNGASRELMSGPMLQALLEDRFKLKVHRETREAPVYILTVAKNGSKLKPFKEGSCISLAERGNVAGDTLLMPQISRSGTLESEKLVDSAGVQHPICIATNWGKFQGVTRTLEVQGQDLNVIGWLLGLSLDRPVIDRTGLTGRFDAHMEFAVDSRPQNSLGPDGQTTPPADKPSIFTAVQKELGLKLEPGRGRVEILMIDHVEKPSEN